jgi:hypothetical protein
VRNEPRANDGYFRNLTIGFAFLTLEISMKTSALVRVVAVAAVAFAPFSVQAQDSEVLNACVDAFVAQNFADKSTTVRFERNYGYQLPLVLQTRAPRVKLVATEKSTDRVLATATCGEKGGIITVEPVKAEVVAAL